MLQRKVLIALPVYNEARHIVPVLAEVRKYSDDVLVVNDGSTDATREILESIPGLLLIHHERNQGYGAGLRSAFQFAIDRGYDSVVTIDCDGQHQPNLIPALDAALDPVDGPAFDIVSGSRYLQTFDGDSTPPEARRRINMRINDLLAERLDLHVTDSFCGFKSYRVEALRKLDVTELGYAMPMQFWVQVVAQKLRFREFPVPLIYLDEERSFGGSLDNADERFAYYLKVFNQEYARWFPHEGEAAEQSHPLRPSHRS